MLYEVGAFTFFWPLLGPTSGAGKVGTWLSVSGFPADKISEIDQTAGLVWLFLSTAHGGGILSDPDKYLYTQINFSLSKRG